MKFFAILLFFLTITGGRSHVQHAAQKQAGAADQLGMSCAQILQMSSTNWVTQFNGKVNQTKNAKPRATGRADGASKPSTETPDVETILRAIAAYGKCYDARTDRLAASLGKTGKGPLMGVRGNFRDFEAALKNFIAVALRVAQTPDDPVKTAYATLYEKQFRYVFYQSYEQKPVKEVPPAAKDAIPTAASTATTAQPTPASRITDPMTLAKNRFGDSLAALPEDKRREVHIAFGQIFEKGSIADQWTLEVYRYAISVLESPKDKPFSMPPF
ncbi:MAG: hypothetical protein WCD43_00590 [Candidatus Acidiferrales bacterium]